MSDTQYRVLENRLRRAAGRQGLRLAKSRARDPRAIGYGQYMIIDAARNYVVAGASVGYPDMNLNEVEDYLTQDAE